MLVIVIFALNFFIFSYNVFVSQPFHVSMFADSREEHYIIKVIVELAQVSVSNTSFALLSITSEKNVN